eukprot:6183674-Pleurochrysis_carterae.AAC.1
MAGQCHDMHAAARVYTPGADSTATLAVAADVDKEKWRREMPSLNAQMRKARTLACAIAHTRVGECTGRCNPSYARARAYAPTHGRARPHARASTSPCPRRQHQPLPAASRQPSSYGNACLRRLHSRHFWRVLLCSQIPPPLHSLQMYRALLCSQMPLPPQSLHMRRCR